MRINRNELGMQSTVLAGLMAFGLVLSPAALTANEDMKEKDQRSTTIDQHKVKAEGQRSSAEKKEGKNLVEALRAENKYTTFISAIERSGLLAELNQGGPYTVFAPTDEAFQKVANFQQLQNDREQLRNILRNHIVETKLKADNLEKVAQGQTIQVEGHRASAAIDGSNRQNQATESEVDRPSTSIDARDDQSSVRREASEAGEKTEGTIERAWEGTKDAVSGAVDATSEAVTGIFDGDDNDSNERADADSSRSQTYEQRSTTTMDRDSSSQARSSTALDRDSSYDQRASARDSRLENKADKLEDHADQRASATENKLEHKADKLEQKAEKVEDRADQQASQIRDSADQRASAIKSQAEREADRLEEQGNRQSTQLSRQADQLEERADEQASARKDAVKEEIKRRENAEVVQENIKVSEAELDNTTTINGQRASAQPGQADPSRMTNEQRLQHHEQRVQDQKDQRASSMTQSPQSSQDQKIHSTTTGVDQRSSMNTEGSQDRRVSAREASRTMAGSQLQLTYNDNKLRINNAEIEKKDIEFNNGVIHGINTVIMPAQRPGAQVGAPGQMGTTPGQSATSPSRAGTTPGQSGTTPGQTGNTPPSQNQQPGQPVQPGAPGAQTAPGAPGTQRN